MVFKIKMCSDIPTALRYLLLCMFNGDDKAIVVHILFYLIVWRGDSTWNNVIIVFDSAMQIYGHYRFYPGDLRLKESVPVCFHELFSSFLRSSPSQHLY